MSKIQQHHSNSEKCCIPGWLIIINICICLRTVNKGQIYLMGCFYFTVQVSVCWEIFLKLLPLHVKKKKKCVCVTDSNVTTNCQQSVLEPKSIYHLQLIHSGFGILVYDVLCRPGNGFWNICMNPWIFSSLRWLDLIL